MFLSILKYVDIRHSSKIWRLVNKMKPKEAMKVMTAPTLRLLALKE